MRWEVLPLVFIITNTWKRTKLLPINLRLHSRQESVLNNSAVATRASLTSFFPGIQFTIEESVSQKFLHLFFHDSNPSGSLTNRLKYFRIWFKFSRKYTNSDSPVRVWHYRVKIWALMNAHLIYLKSNPSWSMYSPIKGFYLRFFIQTPACAFWLCSIIWSNAHRRVIWELLFSWLSAV